MGPCEAMQRLSSRHLRPEDTNNHVRPQAALQVSCSGSTTCIWISADMKAGHHRQKPASHRPATPSPVVIRQLFPSPDVPPGKYNYMVVQQACRCAAHGDGAAVGVGLAGVVQQMRHVACAWQERLSTRREHSAAAALASQQDCKVWAPLNAGRYGLPSAQDMREARQRWGHRRIQGDVPYCLGQVRTAEDKHKFST